MSKQFYTAREISQAIPANYASVLASIHREELPAHSVGGSYVVDALDAELYIKRRQAQADPEILEKLEAQVAALQAECNGYCAQLRDAGIVPVKSGVGA